MTTSHIWTNVYLNTFCLEFMQITFTFNVISIIYIEIAFPCFCLLKRHCVGFQTLNITRLVSTGVIGSITATRLFFPAAFYCSIWLLLWECRRRSHVLPSLIHSPAANPCFCFQMYLLQCLDFTNVTKSASAEMMTATKNHTERCAKRTE